MAFTSATAYANGLRLDLVTTVLDSSDALLTWATNGACASDYPSARAQITAEGNRGFVSDELVSGTSPRTLRVSVDSNIILANGPYVFSTACALLYHGSPNNVNPTPYARAQRQIAVSQSRDPSSPS